MRVALARALEGGRAEAARLARERLWRRSRSVATKPVWREGVARP